LGRWLAIVLVWCAARELAGARHHESARAVMKERGIVDAQQRADHCVLLVARRADRVEAAVRLLQLARRHVQLAREDLILEQLDRLAGGQAATCPEGVLASDGRARGDGARKVRVEGGFDDGDAIPGHGRLKLLRNDLGRAEAS
jgi:hypothetical protein